MGIGPVPSSAIDRWVDRRGLGDEAEAFRTAIRAMDAEFLAHARDEMPTAASDKKPVVQSRPMTPEMFDAMFG